jgi:hypothetical protein
MRRPTIAAILMSALPVAALATADPPVGSAGDIPVEEWQAMASGRTVTYRIDGALWALERYYSGNRVQLQLYDGSCLDGTWDYQAPHYCFHWEGQGTSCFRHARVGDAIVVIQTQDGIDTPLTQDVTAVTDTPLDCGPPATS